MGRFSIFGNEVSIHAPVRERLNISRKGTRIVTVSIHAPVRERHFYVRLFRHIL